MIQETTDPSPPLVVVVGPTAVGKSSLALPLAEEFGADILSADSRQVYRYMDIGTVKPTLADRAHVRHYLLDLVEPDDTFNAARFRREGTRVLSMLARSHRTAIIVGGTGFYLRALLDGGGLPSVSPAPGLRHSLHVAVDEHGAAALHERLRAVDPVSADRIHPNNVARVIRALEIVEGHGGPVPPRVPAQPVPALVLGLRMDRDHLRAVIAARIAAQLRAGFIEEVESLLAAGYDPDCPALQGFGYRQFVAYLQGSLPLSEAVERYTIATSQYARRQMTWFRADERIQWIDADEHALAVARVSMTRYLEDR